MNIMEAIEKEKRNLLSMTMDDAFDCIDESLDRIKAVAVQNNWHPIETAPMDGSEMLGYCKDWGVMLIRWTAPIAFLTDTELEKLDVESAETYGWFYADFVEGGRLDGIEAPTHWHPLPVDPVLPDDKGGE